MLSLGITLLKTIRSPDPEKVNRLLIFIFHFPKDEEFLNHKEEMRIENERERTSSMMDCKHNVLHKLIQLKMEKEIINL